METTVSNLKHFEETKQRESKVDTEKIPATGTSIMKTIQHSPPSTSEPEGAERTCYYT